MRCEQFSRNLLAIRVAAAIIVMGIIILCVYLVINPPDRIRVTVSNLPLDTQFVSLISESNDSMQNLNFYVESEIFYCFTMHPSECIWAKPIYDANIKKIIWRVYVQWRRGDRYGVVTLGGDNIWRVTWFAANDVRIDGHWIILGNGEVHLDISNRKSAFLSDAQRNELQLNKRW